MLNGVIEMKYKKNWEETKKNFTAWWNNSSRSRPLMKIVTRREEPREELEEVESPDSAQKKHVGLNYNLAEIRNYCRTHNFKADAYPSLDLNIGPGSMAVYLGSKPVFSEDTVWYEEIIENDWEEIGELEYDPDNYWWQFHLNLIKEAHQKANGEFFVNIPDIIENFDILASLRGTQSLCFDLIDQPEKLKNYLQQLDKLYFKYYNQIYNVVKDENGGSSFTAFNIWGPGKTAKLQSDFSALISPDQFREFVKPSLENQCQKLDNTVFHLDGPECIIHLDALMEISGLNALQWTPGAANPGGGNSRWYEIYDKVKEADKALHISIYDGEFADWMKRADNLVDRYGRDGLYLLFPEMSEKQGKELIKKAEKDW